MWLAPMPQVCDYTAESYSYVGLALQSGSEEDKEQSSETGSELRDDEWPKRGVFNHRCASPERLEENLWIEAGKV